MSSFFEVHHKLIGKLEQDKISSTSIVVIGVGGLGCVVAEGLVRLGIKKITLVDGDIVQKTNIPRQFLFTSKDIGKPKVEVAKKQLSDIFQNIEITVINDFFTKETTLQKIDIVVDCTDNYTARYAISKKCMELNLPMVYGGVDKFEGQIGVFNYNGSKPFHKVFPNIKELLQNETCTSSGVLPFVVQITGNYQVIEVFKVITNHKELLNNKLLCINFLLNKQRIIKLTTSFL